MDRNTTALELAYDNKFPCVVSSPSYDKLTGRRGATIKFYTPNQNANYPIRRHFYTHMGDKAGAGAAYSFGIRTNCGNWAHHAEFVTYNNGKVVRWL